MRLAVLETVPYALLILLGNIGLQYIFFGGTLLSGLIAVFLPNQVHTFKEVSSHSILSMSMKVDRPGLNITYLFRMYPFMKQERK